MTTTFTEVTYAPMGHIEVPGLMTDEQAEQLRDRWAQAVKDPRKPMVLPNGARFVPWVTGASETVLDEAIEIDAGGGGIKYLAIACVANAIAVIALALSLLLR